MKLSLFFLKINRRLSRLVKYSLTRLKAIVHRPAIFEDGYTIEDNTVVTLYTRKSDSFEGYEPRVDPSLNDITPSFPVLLVAVSKDEALTAREWFSRIKSQTRQPSEIIVVDTGSKDGTIEILKDLASSSPIPFRVIAAPGLNISQGRNLAIRSSSINHIAVTDFGTRAHQTWLEYLIYPFENDSRTEVSGGWYEAVNPDGSPFRWQKWISLLGKNPQDILSPAVSIAFTRTAWERVGGYPEWLTMTGEDTYFDLELKRTSRWWAFCPDALVDWEAPSSVWRYWKKMYNWAIGDGETGMRASAYWYAFIVSGFTLAGLVTGLFMIIGAGITRSWGLLGFGIIVLAGILIRAYYSGKKAHYSLKEIVMVIGILAAQAVGYIKGTTRRLEVTRRRLQSAKNITFVLAGIPIDDTGGGARSTQISLEYLRRRHVVVYLNLYPKSESVDLKLSIRHPNLITSAANQFIIEDFFREYEIKPADINLTAIVELPHKDWISTIDALQIIGGKIIYEVIDEWDSNLGASWYNRSIENTIIEKSHVITATAPVLQARIQQISGRKVFLVPNAVNINLFNLQKTHPIPKELAGANFVITYIGALYGDWFDWELLVNIAREIPDARIIIIGDYRNQCPENFPNLYFLGLKPQTDLPAYLARTDVAIIPWKINNVTQATSPLKLYEYLALHVPVVAPNLPPLVGLPSVFLADNHKEFVDQIRIARTAPIDASVLDQFTLANSWKARVDQLEQLIHKIY